MAPLILGKPKKKDKKKDKNEIKVKDKQIKDLDKSLSNTTKALNKLVTTYNKKELSVEISRKEYKQLYDQLKKNPMSKTKDMKSQKQYMTLLTKLQQGPTNDKDAITRKDYEALLHQLKIGPTKDSKEKDTNKKWQKVVGFMFGGLKGLFKGVAGIAKGLAGHATGILGLLFGLFIILKLGLLQTLIPAALDLLKTLVTGIIKALPAIVKFMGDLLFDILPGVIKTIFDTILDTLKIPKDSPIRKFTDALAKMSPYLLLAFGAFKVLSGILGTFGVKTLPLLIKGFQFLFSSVIQPLVMFLIGNPIALAIAALAAITVGAYAFVKNSEDIEKWAKKKKDEMIAQDASDQSLLKKYKGVDFSKLNQKEIDSLLEAQDRQASVWHEVKKSFFSVTESIAGSISNAKKIYAENNKRILELQLKKNLTDKEQIELQKRLQAKALDSMDILNKNYWLGLGNYLADGYHKFNIWFTRILTDFWDGFTKRMSDSIDSLKSDIYDGFSEIGKIAFKLWGSFLNRISYELSAYINIVSNSWDYILNEFSSGLSSIKTIFSNMIKNIIKGYNSLNVKIESIVNDIGNYILNKFLDIKNSITGIFSKPIKKVSKAVIDPIKNTVSLFFEEMKKSKKKIGDTFSLGNIGDFDKIGSFFKNNFGPILTSLSGFYDTVKGKFSKMDDFFKPFTDKIKEVFATMGDMLGSVIDHIMYSVSKIPGMGHLSNNAKNYETFRSQKIIERIQQDPETQQRVSKLAADIRYGKGDVAIREDMRGLSKDQIEAAQSFAKSIDVVGASFDNFVKQLKTNTQVQNITTRTFFPTSGNSYDIK